MAKLMHFKEAEEIGIIKNDSYVACPFFEDLVLWPDSFLDGYKLEMEQTGASKIQKVQINPQVNFTFQNINHKTGITLVGDQEVTQVTLGGHEVEKHKEKPIGNSFSEYARQLDMLVDYYYSSKSNGVKAWCLQKEDLDNISYSARFKLNGAWLASPFMMQHNVYGLYYIRNCVARTEELYIKVVHSCSEATHKVAVGITLPDDIYIVVDNFNKGQSRERPIMWINFNADNLLSVYDYEIIRLSDGCAVLPPAADDLKRERSVIQSILDKSGKEGLLQGNWIF